MLKTVLGCMLALIAVFLVARSCGLTPEQVESQVMLAELNEEEGHAFRMANRDRAGVVTLPSGLQVELLQSGEGAIPAEDDWVQLHYRGWHIDGRKFQDSWRNEAPVTVLVARTIPGWREALMAMPVGSHVRLVLPPALAYGRPGGGLVGPEETLVFELELLAIVVPEAIPERPESERPVPNLR
jgi:FKBP-type peptidyl-prolyl cis-trans isomerase FkpA